MAERQDNNSRRRRRRPGYGYSSTTRGMDHARSFRCAIRWTESNPRAFQRSTTGVASRHAEQSPGLLTCGVEPLQWPWPFEYSMIGRDKSMPFHGGGDDDTVGGITGKPREATGADSDLAVDWDLDQALPQTPATPRSDILMNPDPALLLQHGDLPKGDRRNSYPA